MVCTHVFGDRAFTSYSRGHRFQPSILSFFSFSITKSIPGMWKRLFFRRFRFHTYRFRFHRFRFHQQKTKKRPFTIFFNFCGPVACLLLHFIILRRQKPSFIAISFVAILYCYIYCYSLSVLKTRIDSDLFG